MKNNSIFDLVMNGRCISIYPSEKLITESIEDLKLALTSLGAVINYQCSFQQNKKVRQFKFGEMATVEVSKITQTIVILPGIDKLPVYILLSRIENIFLNTISDNEKIATIVWKGGGSTNIDGKYYTPLKRYWITVRGLPCIIDMSKKKDHIFKELSKIHEFTNTYNQYIEKDELLKKSIVEQKYGKAASAREEILKLLPKLDKAMHDYLTAFWDVVFEEYL